MCDLTHTVSHTLSPMCQSRPQGEGRDLHVWRQSGSRRLTGSWFKELYSKINLSVSLYATCVCCGVLVHCLSAQRLACIDLYHPNTCWHLGSSCFPVPELHVLSISYLNFWMPTKTTSPVSRPLCQYIKVSCAVSSRKWSDIIYVKSWVQLACCSPAGSMKKGCRNINKQALFICEGGRRLIVVYIAMLHA